MISISSFQGAEQARTYYKHDYYASQEQGEFWGSAAQVFGLKEGENVTEQKFERLLNSLHPNDGKKLTKGHRSGFDVTFSAPKSVSILTEYFAARGEKEKEKALRKAHQKAVREAMREIEKLAYTRVRGQNGNIQRVRANIVYASFMHDTAREIGGVIDPQLHTHNFIFNVVAYTDPKTGEFRTGTIENIEIFRNKMLLGQIYRNQLAKELQNLGFEIEVTDRKNGFFEIKGIEKEILDEFSGRSKQIRGVLEQLREKYPNAKEQELLQIANLETKSAKRKIDRDLIRKKNLERFEELGFSFRFEAKPKREIVDPGTILEKAANILNEHESVFAKKDLLKEALKLGLGTGITKKDLEEAIKSVKDLIQLDGDRFTTRKILEAEKFVIGNLSSRVGRVVGEQGKIEAFLSTQYDNMTAGQRKMVERILYSDRQFLVVQGDAGTGKTYSLKAIKEFLSQERPELEIIGLSFTGKAAAGLEEESGIKSSTIHSFLAKEASGQNTPSGPRLIVVDEAGLTGSLQIAEIVKIAKENGDKVVFVGDSKQFTPIAAGNLFTEMQKYTETVKMEEVLRQKTQLTKEIVRLVKERDFERLFDLLLENEKLHMVENGIAERMVDLFLQKDEDLLIIVSKNKDRRSINEAIHEAMKEKAKIKKEKEFVIYEQANPSGVEKFDPDFYLGKKIMATRVPGLKNGEEAEVVDAKEGKIFAKRDNGKIVEINIEKYHDRLSVYEEEIKAFGVGDRIVFTKNMEELKNGQIAEIKEISGHKITVEMDNGVFEFDARRYRFFDYGYAITDYKAQGVTAKNVAVVADANMATYNSFYTQITRAKEDLEIFVTGSALEQFWANITTFAKKTSTLTSVESVERRKYEKRGNQGSVDRTATDLIAPGKQNGRDGGAFEKRRKEHVRHLEHMLEFFKGVGSALLRFFENRRENARLI